MQCRCLEIVFLHGRGTRGRVAILFLTAQLSEGIQDIHAGLAVLLLEDIEGAAAMGTDDRGTDDRGRRWPGRLFGNSSNDQIVGSLEHVRFALTAHRSVPPVFCRQNGQLKEEMRKFGEEILKAMRRLLVLAAQET